MSVYQTGDLAQFVVNTVSEPGSVAVYVWRFWDAAIQVGTTGTTFKRINIGGDPTNGNQLIYACSPVIVDGESTNLYGTIAANNPPYIAPSPSISRNDDYYGYSTTLSLTAYTIDGHDPILFLWYSGPTFLSLGVAAPHYLTGNHTWRGNDTTAVIAFNGTTNSFTTTVFYDQDITCYAIDTAAGTTAIEFRLRGQPVPPLGGVLVADTNSVTTDASSPPAQRIGPGQTVTFVAYVKDIDNVAPTFAWTFSNISPGNWTVPLSTAGTIQVLPDSSFSSTVVKDISGEVVSSGSIKVCVASCLIVGNAPSRSVGQAATLYFSCELIQNQAPTGTTIVCTDINGTPIDMGTGQVAAGDKIIYSAATADPENDVVDQLWRIDNGATPGYPSPFYQYGPKIVFDTTGMSSGVNIAGQITSTDRMGAVLVRSFSGPKIQ